MFYKTNESKLSLIPLQAYRRGYVHNNLFYLELYEDFKRSNDWGSLSKDFVKISLAEFAENFPVFESPPEPIDRLSELEAENAALWYEIMRKDAHDSEQDSEIATIWYELMTGGAA